ncbi:MAG TPA: peptidase MA family metallohydrolase [candidate division Zixibacteria bacterium]|nr:hypothetical protein [candidate division Zixibacteria bacterium]MDD4917887.1 peptidase MA family metallohydrolase [candidate division Zixibacteria bacterium]MDM7973501.1 peptidase MA family metallohydrolase [candidate division Zixibacteria bacterium]HOD66229.1 peptidase MA family metallohydrolase [candidate division Zixibacteria bacterium]HPM38125.1 peptidase MA family metallohydrolase [candidate division Zixibacteria bacterium]
MKCHCGYAACRFPAALWFALLAGILAPGGGACAQAAGSVAAPVERAHFTYYFDQPHYIDLADTALERARRQLFGLVRDTLTYRADVYLVDNADKFQGLVRGRIPDWGAAVAYPSKGRIAVKSPDKFNLGKPLAQLLTHEYAHLVMAQRTGFHEAPRWFDEGLAQRVSTEWSWLDNVAMSKAAVFGQYLPLAEIELMNRFNEDKAHVAYAQSLVAVNYFFDAYGVAAVNVFLDAVREGASYDAALMRATGSDYAGFEEEFRRYWSGRFNLVTLLADMMWLWFALAVIVVVAAFLKYRKRRSYYRKWEREERLQSTDFDYGDPDNPEEVDDDEPWKS